MCSLHGSVEDKFLKTTNRSSALESVREDLSSLKNTNRSGVEWSYSSVLTSSLVRIPEWLPLQIVCVVVVSIVVDMDGHLVATTEVDIRLCNQLVNSSSVVLAGYTHDYL